MRAFVVVLALATLMGACQAHGADVSVPPDGQRVRITTGGLKVVLDPPTVRAGDVYFLYDIPDDPTGHAGFEFVSRFGPDADPNAPPPMSEADVETLRRDSAPQGMGHQGGWGRITKLRLAPGWYSFLVHSPTSGMPGIPPASVTALEVLP